ncbi:MAG: glycosyltransferase family 4 protein [Desulfobacterales bacterium]
MTKILHIITRLDMGGSAQNTLLTCRELSAKYEMVLVHGLSLESKMTDSEKHRVKKGIDEARRHGVKFLCVSSLVRRINPLKDFRALCSLGWLIFKERPAVVHTHSSKAGILGRLAAKLVGVPIIIHTPHGHVFYGHFNRLASRIFRWIEKWFAFLSDRIIALTEGEKNDYLNLGVGRPHQLLTIHSGVDIRPYISNHVDVIDKKQSLGLFPNGLLIGFVGWLLPIKGPMHLLRAMPEVWSEHPDSTLVFVGKGDLDVDLRSEALQLEANGKVKFLGWRDDVAEIMQIFDIFVLPSLNEGMGRVLVEAMAAGKPVVASKVGGIPDLVKDEKTGLLVPPGDEHALANAIMRLANNPSEARRMGAAGKFYCHPFSLEAMVEQLDHLYDEIIFSPRKIVKLKADTGSLNAKQWVKPSVSSGQANNTMADQSSSARSSKQPKKIGTN